MDGGNNMVWSAPKAEELCVGMEINMYVSARR
ncbi:MAG: pyrroloquinoline quinone precursor peptide PqqA [Pseudomonadota bacterium]